ncbi:MAG: hypothetical protein HKP37_12995 [Boseongicola sp.]|nr:hypothetical protein [Boseongicola sp.]
MRWTCNCGEVELEVAPGDGTRLVCFCSSCQRFANDFGAGDTLEHGGGADLYQTAPEAVSIIKGEDKLSWVKYTAKGPNRWYTTCCETPMANSLSTRNIPFATILSHNIDDQSQLGPVVARVNRKGATAQITEDAGNAGKAIRAFVWRALRSRLSGRYKQNPFFDASGALIASGRSLGD